MGFPCVVYCIILPKPMVLFVQLLDFIRLALSTAFSYVGLCHDHHRLPGDPPCLGSLQVDSSAIKRRLPVVKLASLLGSQNDGETWCAVCLGGLEARHEVRKLGNCRHAFHRRCIDKWVDLGQITCPLCRSLLLPPEVRDEDGLPLDQN